MTVAAGFARTAVVRGSAAPAAVPTLRRRAALSVVPSGEPAGSRAPFVVAVVSLMVAGLLGLLMLNTVVAKDSFRLHALQVEGRKLADREQVLTREVEALRAPSALAARATEMGMVQAGPPAFLRLPDGTVLGAATPAEAPLVDGEPAPVPGAAAAAAAPDATAAEDSARSADSDADAAAGDADEPAASADSEAEETTASADDEAEAHTHDSDGDAEAHTHEDASSTDSDDPEDG